MTKYTFEGSINARTVTGDFVEIPAEVDADQRGWNDAGASFPVIRRDGSKARAVIRGELYGLDTPGTGDTVVAII